MWSMRESALRVARDALTAGEAALPSYGSRYPRHDDTQLSLFGSMEQTHQAR